MKVTISVPQELNTEVKKHILARFGTSKARAFSLIIQEALKEYLARYKARK